MKKIHSIAVLAILSVLVPSAAAFANHGAVLGVDTKAAIDVNIGNSGKGSYESGRDHEEDDDRDENKNDDSRNRSSSNDRWRNWAFNSGITGTVTAVSGDTITVKGSNNITYTVDADDAKVRSAGGVSSVSSIKTGDRVLVQGVVDGTNVVATLIIDAQKNTPTPNDDEKRSAIAGTVTAKSGTTLTVIGRNGTTYTVKAENATVWKNKSETSSLSSVSVGDSVVVQGSMSGSTITASRIYAVTLPEASANGGIRGTVTAVNGDTISLLASNGTTYTVDADSADINDHKNNDEDIDDIEVGETIVVQGDVDGTTIDADVVSESNLRAGFWGRIGGFFKHLFGKKAD